MHPLRALADEADEELRILGASPGPRRILSAVPPRHIYGFIWSVLLPQASGAAVVELHRSSDGAMFRLCRPGDIVVGTPFTWERAAGVGERLPPGVTGVTSAGPSTEATWRAAETIGLERFVEIYGATETGGVGWRDSGLQPFRLLDRVTRDGDGLKLTGGGAVALQDRVIWREDGRFDLGGRHDTVVQVAGTNVSCDAVAAVLEGVEGVSDAVVRLHGRRLVAMVVPERAGADTGKLEDALRARALRELAAPARPDRYHFAAELPRTQTGKLAPWPGLGGG
jgi:4-coumarate--CoA ligase (photoactive yellow protein activation family)